MPATTNAAEPHSQPIHHDGAGGLPAEIRCVTFSHARDLGSEVVVPLARAMWSVARRWLPSVAMLGDDIRAGPLFGRMLPAKSIAVSGRRNLSGIDAVATVLRLLLFWRGSGFRYLDRYGRLSRMYLPEPRESHRQTGGALRFEPAE